MKGVRCTIALVVLTLLPWQAALAGHRIFLTGAEASQQDFYTYVGAIIPAWGWQNGKGLFQRYWLDHFGYEYEAGDRDIEARAWGAEAALGYVSPVNNGWWSASVSLRHTDTDLSPDDRNASARGVQVSPKFQLEGETRALSAWRLAGIVSYTFEHDQYWGRIRATRRMSRYWRAGGEITTNGSDEFSSVGTGMVFVRQPSGSVWSLAAKVGYRFQDAGDGVFAGMEIGRSF